MTYREFLSHHVASSALKQRHFADFLKENGDPDWAVDLQTGQASFGEVGAFPLQIVGTESELDGSWMWGWPNAQSELNPQLLQVANKLRELGKSDGVAEFSAPISPLRPNLGRELLTFTLPKALCPACLRARFTGV